MKSDQLFLPEAREAQIVTREVEGELLIYDRTRDRAHCLNPIAAAIWKLCDGENTARDIARRLSFQEKTDAPIKEYEQVVWLGLEELRTKHLLKGPVPMSRHPGANQPIKRREALRCICVGATIALPVVTTMVAPPPARAASCKGDGHPCNTSADCCSGVCDPPGPGGACIGGPTVASAQRARRSD